MSEPRPARDPRVVELVAWHNGPPSCVGCFWKLYARWPVALSVQEHADPYHPVSSLETYEKGGHILDKRRVSPHDDFVHPTLASLRNKPSDVLRPRNHTKPVLRSDGHKTRISDTTGVPSSMVSRIPAYAGRMSTLQVGCRTLWRGWKPASTAPIRCLHLQPHVAQLVRRSNKDEQDELDSYSPFNSFFTDPFFRMPRLSDVLTGSQGMAHCDIHETEQEYIVSTDVPGIKAEEIDVQVHQTEFRQSLLHYDSPEPFSLLL